MTFPAWAPPHTIYLLLPTLLLSCSPTCHYPIGSLLFALIALSIDKKEKFASTPNLLTYRLRCATKTFVTSWQQHFHHASAMAMAMALATVTRLAWWQPHGACAWACTHTHAEAHTQWYKHTHISQTGFNIDTYNTLASVIVLAGEKAQPNCER